MSTSAINSASGALNSSHIGQSFDFNQYFSQETDILEQIDTLACAFIHATVMPNVWFFDQDTGTNEAAVQCAFDLLSALTSSAVQHFRYNGIGPDVVSTEEIRQAFTNRFEKSVRLVLPPEILAKFDAQNSGQSLVHKILADEYGFASQAQLKLALATYEYKEFHAADVTKIEEWINGAGKAFDFSEHPLQALAFTATGIAVVCLFPPTVYLLGIYGAQKGMESSSAARDAELVAEARGDDRVAVEVRLQKYQGLTQLGVSVGGTALAVRLKAGVSSEVTTGTPTELVSSRGAAAVVPDEALNVIEAPRQIAGPVTESPTPSAQIAESPEVLATLGDGTQILAPKTTPRPNVEFDHPIPQGDSSPSLGMTTKNPAPAVATRTITNTDQAVADLLGPQESPQLPAVITSPIGERSAPWPGEGEAIPVVTWFNFDVDVLPTDNSVYSPTPIDPDAARGAGVAIPSGTRKLNLVTQRSIHQAWQMADRSNDEAVSNRIGQISGQIEAYRYQIRKLGRDSVMLMDRGIGASVVLSIFFPPAAIATGAFSAGLIAENERKINQLKIAINNLEAEKKQLMSGSGGDR